MYDGWGTCASTVVTSGEVITRTQHLLKSHKLSRSSNVVWKKLMIALFFTAWEVDHGNSHLLVISNDTDTIARLLRFIHRLRERGIQQLWVEFGTGERKRHIPLHVLADKLGVELSRVILKAHILTGDDAISTICTKHASLSCDPHLDICPILQNHIHYRRGCTESWGISCLCMGWCKKQTRISNSWPTSSRISYSVYNTETLRMSTSYI